MKFRFDVIHKTQKPFYHLVLILVHTVTDLLKSNSCLLLNFSLEIIFRAHVLWIKKGYYHECQLHVHIVISFKLTKLGTPEKFQELPLLFAVKFYHTLLAISSQHNNIP